jgi:hypothetical protein
MIGDCISGITGQFATANFSVHALGAESQNLPGSNGDMRLKLPESSR